MDDLIDRLRSTPCNREPFTPSHAECQCEIANKAANEIELLRKTISKLELALEQEGERQWWAGFANAADIAKGEKIEATLRSKIEHFKSRRKA